MSPITALKSPVRFGVITPEQYQRIAKEGRLFRNPVDHTLDQFLPQASPLNVQTMSTDFEEQLVDAMGRHFQNPFMSALPEGTKAIFQDQLARLLSRLNNAPVAMPETVIDAIIQAAKTCR